MFGLRTALANQGGVCQRLAGRIVTAVLIILVLALLAVVAFMTDHVETAVTLLVGVVLVVCLAMLSARHAEAQENCRAHGGTPISAGKWDVNCSDGHGGFIDPQVWGG